MEMQQVIAMLDYFISEVKEIQDSIPGRAPLEYRNAYEDGYDQGQYSLCEIVIGMIEKKRKELTN